METQTPTTSYRTPRRPTLVHAVMLIAAATASAQSITDLGVLPGASETRALGVSADGSIVVGVSGGRAFRWTRSGRVEELPPLPGHAVAVANAVNADGSVIAGSSGDSVAQAAVRWTAAGAARIGPSAANAISADGSAVAGYEIPVEPVRPPRTRGWRWTEGAGTEYLGTLPLPHHDRSYANAISSDGLVVAGWSGYYEDRELPGTAFRWTLAGGMEALAPSEDWSASAMSGDGSIVVGSSCSAVTFWCTAFRWTASGGMERLSPGLNERASAISGDGSVVAGAAGPWPHIGVLWMSPLEMLDLNVYLPTLGIDITGWELHEATGLNDDGTIIVGNGTYNGQPRAWIVDLNSSCYADCDASGALDFFDFLCFQNLFAAGNPAADCDGSGQLDFFDFLCFQNEFAAGCP